MEPGNQQYGESPADQWPREVGPRGWAPPQSTAARGGEGHAPAHGRTWLIVLAALLTELIIIAAADNQWVSDRIIRDELRTNSQALRSLANSWLTYTWRLSPRDGANANQVWGSQVALVLTVLVVTGLLVAAVVRGPVTFGRAFFGTWMAVIVATLVGGFVRGLIEPFSKLQMPNSSRLTRAVFGAYGAGQGAVAAGFALGLAVAVVAAIAAVASRRSGAEPADPDSAPAEQPPPYQQPEQPPPYYGDVAQQPAGRPEPSPSSSSGPPWPTPASSPSSAPAAADEPTTRYRPIDEDDDLGDGPEEGAPRR